MIALWGLPPIIDDLGQGDPWRNQGFSTEIERTALCHGWALLRWTDEGPSSSVLGGSWLVHIRVPVQSQGPHSTVLLDASPGPQTGVTPYLRDPTP